MSTFFWNDTIDHSLNTYMKGSVHAPTPNFVLEQGMISELVYSEQHPLVDHILLPFLRKFGDQSRWLLWLSPNKKVSKKWLMQSGLPLDKMMQLNHIDSITTVEAMEKALTSGNYSIVLGWLPELKAQDFARLEKAAQIGNSIGLIMRPKNTNNNASTNYGQLNLSKIHNFSYH